VAYACSVRYESKSEGERGAVNFISRRECNAVFRALKNKRNKSCDFSDAELWDIECGVCSGPLRDVKIPHSLSLKLVMKL
jgi:hypothetical protein